MRLVSSRFFVLMFAVMLAGCRGSDQSATFRVSGTVVFPNGAPVKGVRVKFRTTDRVPAVTVSGITNDQGKFQFSAVEGEHAAVVMAPVPEDTDLMTPAERERAMNPLDPMFLNYERSRLRFTVAGDPTQNEFQIKVWPPRR
jgi:hypothetical protein